jgi:TolB-like protein
VKQIGRELGVRYVLEGSVQQSGNEVRVNTCRAPVGHFALG